LFLITLNDSNAHSVGLLWMRDRPVAVVSVTYFLFCPQKFSPLPIERTGTLSDRLMYSTQFL